MGAHYPLQIIVDGVSGDLCILWILQQYPQGPKIQNSERCLFLFSELFIYLFIFIVNTTSCRWCGLDHGDGVFLLLLLPHHPVELPYIPRAIPPPVPRLPATAEGLPRPVLRRRSTTTSPSKEDDWDWEMARTRADHVVFDRDRQRRSPPSARGHSGEHIRQLSLIQSRQCPWGVSPRFVARWNHDDALDERSRIVVKDRRLFLPDPLRAGRHT